MSTVCFQRRTDHLTPVLTSLQSLAAIKSINCVSSHQQHLRAEHRRRPARDPICHAVWPKWLSSSLQMAGGSIERKKNKDPNF
jgi:hypothetical protein